MGGKVKAIAEYEQIRTQANKVVYTAQENYSGCMHKRNRHLVDNSSVCVCYLTKDGGGTDYTVGYARLKELDVINLVARRGSNQTSAPCVNSIYCTTPHLTVSGANFNGWTVFPVLPFLYIRHRILSKSCLKFRPVDKVAKKELR